jgi:membrane fusion protein, heavy metal efflux system
VKWASLNLTLVFVLSLVFACAKESAPLDVSTGSRLVTVDDEGRIELAPASRAHIETAEVGRDEGGAAVRAPGRVEFRDGAVPQVNAPVEGRVVEVHVRIGDEVKEGDPIVTLRSPEAAAIRNEVDRLRIPLQGARAELERQERLIAQGIGVSSEHFSAQMQVAEIEGEYERARASARLLGNGGGPTVTVRAAMSGTVLTVNTSLGAMADPTGDALVII